MRFVLNLLAMFAVALAVGFGLSYYALTDGRLFAAVQVGPWSTWPQIGAPSPDPYTRAYLARTGAMQLGQAEGLQFIAHTDSDGQPLERACTYRLAGTTPVASFWTLVAVSPQWVNIAPSGSAPALHSTRIARENDGSAVIAVSPRLATGNWLETTGVGPFWLVLTLYDATAFSGFGGTVSSLPAITREAC
ncbi:DUF1214 domain-containing protein [Arsenicitalea aurantiaca]|uniref:DUF1214 domain-containing protein n=1 Tax=Arsenicitalea aurantiaca TaxID=1783274 RepID=A0A433XA97_9HYPH|nr:DUF1214 domain-containing protein [Arsenicitalea aurantiaca]RUT31017.1 DUF1214 domain-containing protein [Arsenicitalea aurantiaca]